MAEDFGADWELEINLSGVKAAAQGNPLAKGYYKVKIEGISPLEKSPDRLMIKMKFPEGQNRNEFINKPKGPDDNVRVYWRALCESCGHAPAQLDKGEIKLGPKTFVGRTAHVFYDPEGNTYNGKVNHRISFLAPGTWTEQKSAFEGKDASSGESASTNNGVGSTTKSSMSEDEVRALLS